MSAWRSLNPFTKYCEPPISPLPTSRSILWCHFVNKVGNVNRLQVFLAIQALCYLNVMLTKVSVLLLFNRIFGHTRAFRVAFRVTIILVISHWFLCTLFVLLGCVPFEKNWDRSLSGSCIDWIMFSQLGGTANVFLDVLIFLLPLPLVWNLDLPLRQRLEAMVLFSLGSL